MSFSRCLSYKPPASTSEAVWQCFGEGGGFIARVGGQLFTFATGQQATLKVDFERLGRRPDIVDRLLSLYALHPCVIDADALSLVPNGVAKFTDELGRRIGKPVIGLFRPEGALRSDIRFRSTGDQERARNVTSVCMIEDISRTGFSAHAAARVLRSVNPKMDIHTLSMLQRDTVDPQYQKGPGALIYHTFVRRDVPLSIDEFRKRFPDTIVQVVS